MPQYHLIYERSGNIWISTFPYPGWEAIQNAYSGYMTSLQFSSLVELREFLCDEYRLTDNQLDLSLENIQSESPEPLTIKLELL